MCSTSTIPMHIFLIFHTRTNEKQSKLDVENCIFNNIFPIFMYQIARSSHFIPCAVLLCVCTHNLSIFRSDVVTWSGFMIVKSLWNHLECDCFSALHFDNIQPVSQLALCDCVVVLLLLLLLLLWSGSVSFFVNSGSLQQPWNLVFCMPFSLDLVHRASNNRTIELS